MPINGSFDTAVVSLYVQQLFWSSGGVSSAKPVMRQLTVTSRPRIFVSDGQSIDRKRRCENHPDQQASPLHCHEVINQNVR